MIENSLTTVEAFSSPLPPKVSAEVAIITQGNFYSRQRKLNTILFTPGQKISARVAQKRFFRLGSTHCLEQDKDLERLRFIHEQLEEHGCTMPWMLHFTRFYL